VGQHHKDALRLPAEAAEAAKTAGNGGILMSEQQPCRRSKISTVVAPETVELTERAAEERRTTPSQVMRVLIEDGASGWPVSQGGCSMIAMNG
jgi:hypothetical protein